MAGILPVVFEVEAVVESQLLPCPDVAIGDDPEGTLLVGFAVDFFPVYRNRLFPLAASAEEGMTVGLTEFL